MKTHPPATAGSRLRDLRQHLHLTQAEFANRFSVTANTVARWERDELGMSKSTEGLIDLIVLALETPAPTDGASPIPTNKRRK
jgi:transcriptional regulator with XRE-family HTH domain